MSYKLLYKPSFVKKYKKLTKQEQLAVTEAVDWLCDNPNDGQQKKGDLAHLRVYKFNFKRRQYLLAYELDPVTMTIHAVGFHENFYRDLKK
jgi:mRNA interferase RelE/StbE